MNLVKAIDFISFHLDQNFRSANELSICKQLAVFQLQ